MIQIQTWDFKPRTCTVKKQECQITSDLIVFQFSLLVSQEYPVKPARHLQEYEFTALVQVPPFWHGLLSHSFISGGRDKFMSEVR